VKSVKRKQAEEKAGSVKADPVGYEGVEGTATVARPAIG
jgi:hypothetical protein